MGSAVLDLAWRSESSPQTPLGIYKTPTVLSAQMGMHVQCIPENSAVPIFAAIESGAKRDRAPQKEFKHKPVHA